MKYWKACKGPIGRLAAESLWTRLSTISAKPSPESIAEIPTLSLGQVYGVVAFFLASALRRDLCGGFPEKPALRTI
jgi:hypothetical protein